MRRSLGAGWRPWVQAAFCPASAADEGKLRLALRASRHSRRWFPRRVLFGEGQCVLKQSERAGEGPDAGIGRARLLAALGNGPLVGRQPVPGPSFEKRPFASSAVALLSPEEVQRQPLRSSASLKARPEEEEKEKRRRQGVSAETALVQKALRILRIRATAYWVRRKRVSLQTRLEKLRTDSLRVLLLSASESVDAAPLKGPFERLGWSLFDGGVRSSDNGIAKYTNNRSLRRGVFLSGVAGGARRDGGFGFCQRVKSNH